MFLHPSLWVCWYVQVSAWWLKLGQSFLKLDSPFILGELVQVPRQLSNLQMHANHL